MIAMTFTALPITANAVDVDAAASGNATVIDVATAGDLFNACSTINAGSGAYVINLTDDITNGYIDISNSNAVVTIVGNGHTLARPNGGTSISVSNGATVNLGDGNTALTISSGTDNDVSGIVYVLGGSSVCNMYDKVTLKDHKGNNYLGGGVTVEGGTFRMYGGTIQNCGIDGGSVCYGGGVAVFAGGTFEMSGGTIQDCYANSTYRGNYNSYAGVGGGVLVTDYSTFTMSGGTIKDNTATYFGGGVAFMASLYEISDHGQYGVTDSQFNLSGGTISGNKADLGAGIFASGWLNTGYFPFGTNQFGSAPEDPGLNITGGTITENEAASDGGGVCIFGIRPSYQVNVHNALITDNKAVDGAGLEVNNYWTEADIDNCTITGNIAENNGGGVALFGNSSGNGTLLKNTTITGNTSGNRGAGVFYDAASKLTISGENVIQDNTYNGTLNNLNIYKEDDTVYPVYVGGDLSGSQIGLSDPKLWDDGLEDEADGAVSEDYLTSGFKTNNNGHPANYFTSDHETWSADFSDVNENEVRLIRGAEVNYYINNEAIADECYHGEDIFTQYVTQLAHTVRVGDKIKAFYPIPQHDTNYIFKGWYYDSENEVDTSPVQFGTDKYLPNKDIYAHWIKVEDVDKDEEDQYPVPYESGKYGGFDLPGVQIREEMLDRNFDMVTPGGMRFITTLSMDVVNEINNIKPNNIEYGYVAATHEGWINYHKGYEKLQYVSKTANGINTLNPPDTAEGNKSYFGFAHNINCTSRVANSSSYVVPLDHKSYEGYLIYSLVINYEAEGEDKGKDILARPYIKYEDANGLERVAYSDYRGNKNVLGGCYTNYNTIAQMAGI